MAASVETYGAPTITLGGKEWPVPPLAVRQNRIVDPIILGLIPLFVDLRDNGALALTRITDKQYDALIEIAYQGVTRAHADITRAVFDEMPITLNELISAMAVVAKQTGIFKVMGNATAEDEPQQGEAPAENPQIGTQS